MNSRDMILKLLEAACGDACCHNTMSSHVLSDFDSENKCEIVDIRFNPSTGVFTLEIEGAEVKEETLKLGLEVEVVKSRDSN